VNHSIFGAAAHILRGDVAVAYSGDLRQERRFDEGVRKSGKGGVRPYHPGDPRRAGRSSRRREERFEALALAPATSLQHRPGVLPGGEWGGGRQKPWLREGASRLRAPVPRRPGPVRRSDRSGPDRPHQHLRRGGGSPIASRAWCWRGRGWGSIFKWCGGAMLRLGPVGLESRIHKVSIMFSNLNLLSRSKFFLDIFRDYTIELYSRF